MHLKSGFSKALSELGPEGKKIVERDKKGTCPFCGKEVNSNDFRDELSRKEFRLSGLCQTCQDKTFD